MIRLFGGGGGGLPPGVSGDGQALGGLALAGNLAVAGAQSGGPAMLGVGSGGQAPYNAQCFIGHDGELHIEIVSADYSVHGFQLIRERPPRYTYGGSLLNFVDYSAENQLLLNLRSFASDGFTLTGQFVVGMEGGAGLFGHAPATAPRTLAQSAITAITDANAKTAVQALANALSDMGALTLT